eukprot:m.190040 g.190040  ORF g.190040 m.190040 type:complete len:1456 (+) comp16751_c0_seq1:63-4430(+)
MAGWTEETRHQRLSEIQQETDDDDSEYSDLFSAWIERTFVMHIPPEGQTKPDLNMCRTVPSTCYGQVIFDTATSSDTDDKLTPSLGKPFIRLSSTTKPSLVTQLLCEQWDLRLPRFIISVTGGATTFELPPRLDRMIRQGLRKAATSSNAWIVTGGTNTGVMKYVGEAIQDVQTKTTSPLICIAPWSIVNNKEILSTLGGEPVKGGVVHYGDPDNFPKPYCSLDRNHTHFILVDNGTLDEFGGEIKMRADIEENVASSLSLGRFGIQHPIASVVIAIQGGPGTLRTCLEAVRNKIPIVVVNGSGKAADAIAYGYNLKHNAHNTEFSLDGLRTLVKEDLSTTQEDGEIEKLVAQVLECCNNPDQVSIFEVDFYGRHDVGLDVAILDAVLRWETANIAKGRHVWLQAVDVDKQHRGKEKAKRLELRKARLLELALTWDRIDIARQETAKYRVLKNFDDLIGKDPIVQAKARMLKYALIHNRKEFVQIFLETMDVQDVSAFLHAPTTSEMTLPSLRNFTRRRAKSKNFPAKKIKWRTLKTRFAVPLPPELDTDPLPTHCQGLIQDVAATKLFSDLKFFYDSRLLITESDIAGYNFNLDIDADDVPDYKRREELTAVAKHVFNLERGCNAWHLLNYFDVYFLRFLLGQGYMISRVEKTSFCPPPCHELIVDDLCCAIHLLWVHRMLDDGWTWSPELDTDAKQSPLICSFHDQGDGSAVLSDKIKQDMKNSALRFLKTLLSSLHIVIWRPTTFEDLFIRPTAAKTPIHRARTSHLLTLFPGGSFWEFQFRKMLTEAVGSDATYASLYALDPFFLLTLWAAVTNFPDMTCYFWRLSPGNIIPNGLVTALLIQKLLNDSRSMPPETSVQYEELLGNILKQSTELLNYIDQQHSKLAEAVLRSRSVHAGLVPTTTLAYNVGNETFVALPAFLRVLRLLWYGDVDPTNGLLKIIFTSIVPVYLFIPGHKPRDDHGHHGNRSFFEYVVEALPVRIDTSIALDANNDGVINENDDLFEEIIRDSSVMDMDAIDLGSKGLMVRHATFISRQHSMLGRAVANVVANQDSYLNATARRFVRFYSAPVVGFTLDTLSYILLLIIFSYSALLPTTSWQDGLIGGENWATVVVFFWMMALIVEEMRQALQQGLNAWWAQLWNKWDVLIYSLYIIAVVLRLSSDQTSLGRSRYVYSSVAIMLWTRLARHYAVNQDLGPKLIMIQLMVKDIMVFLGLMVLVFAGYSVALYSVLEENTKWRQHTFTEMVFMPYFQIYGELFLEEMLDKTNCLNPEFTECGGDSGWFAAPLLAAYIMIANILLVNLLIAMMSSTYEAVQSRALELWAYQNLDALFEVNTTWFLPAPFNVVRNVYLGVRWTLNAARSLLQASNKVSPSEESEQQQALFDTYQYMDDDLEEKIAELAEKFWEEEQADNENHRLLEAIKRVETDVSVTQRMLLHEREEILRRLDDFSTA